MMAADKHTYMVQRHRMRFDWPLTFSDGERIVAVLKSEPAAGSRTDIDVTVLVELPGAPLPAGVEDIRDARGT